MSEINVEAEAEVPDSKFNELVSYAEGLSTKVRVYCLRKRNDVNKRQEFGNDLVWFVAVWDGSWIGPSNYYLHRTSKATALYAALKAFKI